MNQLDYSSSVNVKIWTLLRLLKMSLDHPASADYRLHGPRATDMDEAYLG